MPSDQRKAFRNALLPATCNHAFKRVRGYADLWANVAHLPRTIEELSALPLVEKRQMSVDQAAFRDPSFDAAAVQHTGGTTRTPLVIHRSAAELLFIERFFTKVIRDSALPAELPLCLSVLGDFHGDPTPMPYPGPTFRLNVNDSYWDLHALLTQPGDFIGRPCENIMLVGLESQLRILTTRLIETGFDFADSRVTSVHSTGDLITSRLREFYEGVWKAPLTSRYSMSEVFGGAENCAQCGYYHCDTHIVGEVVDPRSGAPIDAGCGVLTLTCLYPFVQMQPFIRYRTGDLVELGPRDCPVDSLAFRLMGREIHSIVDASADPAQPLIAAAELYDILDAYPEVALGEFEEMFRSLDSLPDRHDLGHLKYRLTSRQENGRQHIDLQIALRFTPYLYESRTRAVIDDIRAEIMRRHPYLAESIRNHRVDFDITAVSSREISQVQVDETE